jgi:hypothetical protein
MLSRNGSIQELVRRATVVGLIMAGLATSVYSSDWPCYRGPNKDGATAESITVWPPQKLWTASIGSEYAGVVVSEHRVYTVGWSGGNDTVYCFSDSPAATNPATPLWTYSCAVPWTVATVGATDNQQRYVGAKSSPTVDGNQVYTISINGILNCLDKASGTLLWSRTIATGSQPDFGITGAPLIEGNLVIVNACGHGVAVDKTTHNVVWGDTNTAAMHGYATPYAVTIGSTRTIVMYSDQKVYGLDPATGNTLWWGNVAWAINQTATPDPIICNGKLWVSTLYGQGCGAYTLGSAPSGQLTQLWMNSSMENMNCAVLSGNYVYGVDYNSRVLKCMDPADGSVKWSGPDVTFGGAVMMAGGQFVLLDGGGLLSVVDATSAGYTVAHSGVQVVTDTSQNIPTCPTIANGVIYVRGSGTLNAYKVGTTGSGGGNQAPTVSITSPANNATYNAPASVSVTASASDTDGTIASVTFYQGSTQIGQATGSPYTINWTGVAAGSYSLKAVALDNQGAAATSTPVSITVNGGGPVPTAPPVITPPIVAESGWDTAMLGSYYSYQIVATNWPTSYRATGLPTGFTIDTASGLISGIPTAGSGSFSISMTASNSLGVSPAVTLPLSLLGTSRYTGTTTRTPYVDVTGVPGSPGVPLNVPDHVVMCANYDLGGEGIAYHDTDVGNHYSDQAPPFNLPYYRNPHDDVDMGDGSGTGVHGNGGEWTKYSINVTTSGTYNISFLAGCANAGGHVHIEIDGVNVTGSIGIGSAGTWTPYTILVPAGTTIYAGPHTLRLFVEDQGGMTLCSMTFIRTGPPVGNVPSITSGSTASGTVGQAFPTYTITANNGPTSFNAVNLPAGLSVSTGSGQITGTPTTPCTNAVTISASNTYGVGTATLTITINAAGSGSAPVITSGSTAAGTVGQAFPTYTITANNSPTSFNAVNLPAGLSVSMSSGQITGTPTTACTNAVTISASNSFGVGTATLTITINPVSSGGTGISRVNCGGSAVGSFAADNGSGYYVSGGTPFTTTSNIDLSGVSSAAPTAVYQSARYTDNLGYIFSNLTVGAQYKVRLHFADIFGSVTGARIFEIDVLHASQVVTNFDLAAAAGGANKAVIKEFTVVADSSGQIDIWMHATGGHACSINAIEILAPSGPVITIAPKTNQAGMLQLSWPSDVGTTYAVYKCTNLLAGWPAQPYTNFTGDGSTKSFSEAMGSQNFAYYRIKASQ